MSSIDGSDDASVFDQLHKEECSLHRVRQLENEKEMELKTQRLLLHTAKAAGGNEVFISGLEEPTTSTSRNKCKTRSI